MGWCERRHLCGVPNNFQADLASRCLGQPHLGAASPKEKAPWGQALVDGKHAFGQHASCLVHGQVAAKLWDLVDDGARFDILSGGLKDTECLSWQKIDLNKQSQLTAEVTATWLRERFPRWNFFPLSLTFFSFVSLSFFPSFLPSFFPSFLPSFFLSYFLSFLSVFLSFFLPSFFFLSMRFSLLFAPFRSVPFLVFLYIYINVYLSLFDIECKLVATYLAPMRLQQECVCVWLRVHRSFKYSFSQCSQPFTQWPLYKNRVLPQPRFRPPTCLPCICARLRAPHRRRVEQPGWVATEVALSVRPGEAAARTPSHRSCQERQGAP